MTKTDYDKIPPEYDFNKKKLTPIQRITGLMVVLIVASFVLLLGAIYFMITIWVVKLGAAWSGFETLSGETVILTSGIITAGVLISSAMQKM